MAQITASNLTKVYDRKGKGTVTAVDHISFGIEKGDFVGYVGQNGSGKSTTIKMLTGIIVPTSGTVSSLGCVPWEQRQEYAQHIGVVLGSKPLLMWHIPVMDSFLLFRDIYGLTNEEFKTRLDYFDGMLRLSKLYKKPVRKLSLGERMKCNLAASLLHKPDVIFLDEPTIGLDILTKEAVRKFLKEINAREKTTIMLTTHDMGDVDALCKRIMIIDAGKILIDDELSKVKRRYSGLKRIDAEYDSVKDRMLFDRLAREYAADTSVPGRVSLKVKMEKRENLKEAVDLALRAMNVSDLDVRNPDLSEIMAQLFGGGQK